MNPKKLVVLSVLLVLLGAAAWFKHSGDVRRAAAQNSAATVTAVLPSNVNPAFVSRIRIKDGTRAEETVFAKDAAGEWSLQSRLGIPAIKASVESFLKDVTELKGEMRSDSKDVLGDYRIGEDEAVRVRLEDPAGSELGTLLVSRSRAMGAQNFVRVAGSDRVFVTRTDLLSLLGVYSPEDPLDPKLFADLRVTRIDLLQVTSFSIRSKKGETIKIVKRPKAGDKPEYWEYEPAEKSAVEAPQVTTFLGKVVNLYATDGADAASQDWGEPWIVVDHAQDGKPVQTRLFLGALTESSRSYVVKSEPTGVAFTLPEASVDPLFADRAFFAQKSS